MLKWLKVFTFALLLPLPCSAQLAPTDREFVILLHGLGRTGLSMKAVQWYLDDYDYVVVNVSYPSLSYPIEELATLAVEQGLRDCKDEGASTINFVTHFSMFLDSATTGAVSIDSILLQH